MSFMTECAEAQRLRRAIEKAISAMDPFMRLLIMMRRLAQRRISGREFVALMIVLAVCLAAGLFEYVFGWPEALTVERPRIHRTPL